MDVVGWILVVAAVIAIAVALFAMFRHRQRSGAVLASKAVTKGESSL